MRLNIKLTDVQPFVKGMRFYVIQVLPGSVGKMYGTYKRRKIKRSCFAVKVF